jgi:hypothetical protein
MIRSDAFRAAVRRDLPAHVFESDSRRGFAMYRASFAKLIALSCVASWLAACERSAEVAVVQDRTAGVEALPLLVVYKSESCGCCGEWVKYMERAGFKTEVHNVDNLNPIKESVGLPPMMGSCHTARVGKYFVEGHVPVEDVKRLLAEQPDAKGLTVPRMPIGSPGMEAPSGEVERYDVMLVANDGSTSVFASHGDD